MKPNFLALGLLTASTALAVQPAFAQYGQGQPASSASSAPQTNDRKGEAPAAGNERKITISKPAQKAVMDLQNAVTAKDTATIPAKLAAARAVAKTPEDLYYIATLELRAGIAAQDYTVIASAIEAIIATNQAPQDELAINYLNLGKAYRNLKQYDKAIPAIERAAQLTPSDTEIVVFLGDTQVTAGQTAQAIQTLRKAIATKQAAGQKANESWHKRALTLAYDSKSPMTSAIAREWVQAYPTSSNWKDAIGVYRNLTKPPEPVLMDLLRLARVTDSLNGDPDYNAYAYIAVETRNAAEGKALIDAAAAAGKIDLNKPIFKEIQAGFKNKPMPGEDILEKSAATQLAGSDGAALLVTANRFYGIGKYARAAELFRAALAKPGIDKDQANLELGIALAAAGDKAGAKAAFDAVGGTRTEVAKYWLAYLASKA